MNIDIWKKLPNDIFLKIISSIDDIDIRRSFGIYKKIKIPDGFAEKYKQIPKIQESYYLTISYDVHLGQSIINSHTGYRSALYIISKFKESMYANNNSTKHVHTCIYTKNINVNYRYIYTNFCKSEYMINDIYSIGFDQRLGIYQAIDN